MDLCSKDKEEKYDSKKGLKCRENSDFMKTYTNSVSIYRVSRETWQEQDDW